MKNLPVGAIGDITVAIIAVAMTLVAVVLLLVGRAVPGELWILLLAVVGYFLGRAWVK